MSSRYRFATLGLFGLVTASASACSREIPRAEQVVLEVGGRAVSLGEFDRFVQTSVQQESPVLSSEVMSALFEQFIEEQLLLRAADEAGIVADPRAVAARIESLQQMVRQPGDVPSSEDDDGATAAEAVTPGATAAFRTDDEATARDVERHLRIERLVATEALAGLVVPDEEIAAYFESHRDDFVRPETVDVSQILVDDEAQAKELRTALVTKKRTFEDLAREKSQGPDAANGGHLGTFTRGELPPSFEAQVFVLKPGALSEVVATDFGYHIFRLNGRTEQQQLGLDDAREAIRVELLRKKGDEAMRSYVSELEKRFPVKVYHEHLTFAVAGRVPEAPGESSARMEKSR
jgi:peptidyl-prolyl cis-trans isomerase C